MILSVSRRTDIPSYFSDWFFERLKETAVCIVMRTIVKPR